MFRNLLCIAAGFLFLTHIALGQETGVVSVHFVKSEAEVVPGNAVNLAFQIHNTSTDTLKIEPEFRVPDRWALITNPGTLTLLPQASQIAIVSLRSGANYPVGTYPVIISLQNANTNKLMAEASIGVKVSEIENITLQLIEKPGHVLAGESIGATYLVQNLGNTTKNLFISTSNCDVEGNPELELHPGESKRVKVQKVTRDDIYESRNETYSVRAKVGDRIVKSVHQSTIVLPSRKSGRDLFFRFPVKASATYLATNRQNNYQSAYQFQVEGRGTLDPQGKHQLGFMARWPNNTNLSFLGLYDQYYLYYSQENVDVFLGEKSYTVTPLTENSRFGRGIETKVKLNNGLGFGFMYIRPRFYEEIDNELAGFTDFNFNKDNRIGVYYLAKKFAASNDPAQLVSLTADLNPFERTNIEMELSRAAFSGEKSNAYRAGLNSQFSIFQVSGIFYNTGKFYPGYYSNSRFYSANVSAQVSQKLSLSMNAREDFSNAELDTFFVIAPYSQSLQAALGYRLGAESSLKLYWRQYERKDRLSQQKFHYQTDSWNLQYNQRYKRLSASLTGEIGETTNFLLDPGENRQKSYRATASFNYRFNSRHSVRVFGNWSNINQFVSNDQRSVMAGLSAYSRISKNLRLNFYLQNAYDIDDYYRNRNLMQLNLDYNFFKRHSLSVRSFYTIFRNELSDPEFTVSLTYAYNLGIPLKQVVSVGSISGRVVDRNGEPVEGAYLRILNETTVSNADGEFEFKQVQPGRQLLMLDRGKLKIDEITSVPMPLEVEVEENQESVVNIQIVKGAQISGQLVLGKSALSGLEDETVTAENIVVELKTDFETYRIATDKSGNFSFPLIRPGTAVLQIYANTIPSGYSSPQSKYSFQLSAGEHRKETITLESKKKKIIFKPSGNALSVGKGFSTLSVTNVAKTKAEPEKPYYTIQIGAFRKKLDKEARFLNGLPFYFEKQIDNFHKYFVGKFDDYNQAREELNKLKERYKNAFIEVVEGDKIISLEEYRANKQRQ